MFKTVSKNYKKIQFQRKKLAVMMINISYILAVSTHLSTVINCWPAVICSADTVTAMYLMYIGLKELSLNGELYFNEFALNLLSFSKHSAIRIQNWFTLDILTEIELQHMIIFGYDLIFGVASRACLVGSYGTIPKN